MVFGLGKKKDKQKKTLKAPTRGKKSGGGLFSPISRFFFNIISKYSALRSSIRMKNILGKNVCLDFFIWVAQGQNP